MNSFDEWIKNNVKLCGDFSIKQKYYRFNLVQYNGDYYFCNVYPKPYIKGEYPDKAECFVKCKLKSIDDEE